MDAPNVIPRLILASASPRRKALLREAGLSFAVIPSRVDETRVPLCEPAAYVRRLAEAKAGSVSAGHPESWVIGADTVVKVDDALLGKPAERHAARRMIERLNGRSHDVLTGYAVQCRDQRVFFSDCVSTRVEFKQLTAAEISWYADTGEPLHKAGGYAIQGLGVFLVKRVDGSYTNVVGLPVCEILAFFIDKGLIGPLQDGRWQRKMMRGEHHGAEA